MLRSGVSRAGGMGAACPQPPAVPFCSQRVVAGTSSLPARTPQTTKRSISAAKASVTTAATAKVDDATLQGMLDKFITGYQHSQFIESSYWVEEVEGRIPADLSGTLLRNGPGLFEVGSKRVAQPFDGDGLVCSFAFQDGHAFFRSRYVRTEGFVAEQRAQAPLYRSAFNKGLPEGTWFLNPLDLSVKNIANTNVMHWGGKTLALYERGLPHALDSDLKTIGTDDLGGSVDGNKFFGAHYRTFREADGAQRLVAFSFGEAGMDALITLWEYDDQFQCLHKIKRTLPAAAFGFFHDVAVTENYYVLLENPTRLDFWKLLSEYTVGKACIAECLTFDQSLGVKVWLIPRPGRGQPDGPDDMRCIRLPQDDAFFTFHHSNAFELPGGRHVVIDTCAQDSIDFSMNLENASINMYKNMKACDRFSRVVVDLATGTAVRHAVSDRNADLPTVSAAATGRPSRHTYLYASSLDRPDVFGPPGCLWKVTMDPGLGAEQPFDRAAVAQAVWSPGPSKIAQEPCFVPRPGATSEDDGWLLAMVFDASTVSSELAILDARNIEAGPVAVLKLKHHIPLGLHGSFTPAYLGPAPGDRSAEGSYNIKNGV